MDNSKKNVHSTGPLGMLVKTGQIKKIDLAENSSPGNLQHLGLDRLKATTTSYFRTQAGIDFKENELIFIDPKECEPWEYANRSDDEMGNMDELITSIKQNSQLQPALVRAHPYPRDGVRFQIIFGRRRHTACLQLAIPFLVIKKDSLSTHEAISCQDAENKFRKNISNYSNALLYKKLLENKDFKSERELAEKLRLSTSTLNDIMSYTRIPKDIVQLIPRIHELSAYMATKIVRLLSEDKNNHAKMIIIASEIGRSISTPIKLEKALKDKEVKYPIANLKKYHHSKKADKLFIFKVDHKGTPSILFCKELLNKINFDALCTRVLSQIELEMDKSECPDIGI